MPLGEQHVRAIAVLVAYADPIGATCQLSGGTISMSVSTSDPGTGLLDRLGERAAVDQVLARGAGG